MAVFRLRAVDASGAVLSARRGGGGHALVAALALRRGAGSRRRRRLLRCVDAGVFAAAAVVGGLGRSFGDGRGVFRRARDEKHAYGERDD